MLGYKVERSRQYFDSIAEEYDSMEFFDDVRAMHDRFVSRIVEKGATVVLDAGCGTGSLLMTLSEAVPDTRLYGLDISEKMLEQAGRKLGERAELLLGDSVSIPLGTGSCDVVCCNHSFHHYPDPSGVVREFGRVLAPGGILLIGENFSPWFERIRRNLGYMLLPGFGDVHVYSEDEFQRLLSHHFYQFSYELVGKKACFVSAVRGNT